MTVCYITIDVEYEFGFTRRFGLSTQGENFNRSIICKTPNGVAGVGYQMDVLDRYGLKAVFFVDPMPALVWGGEAIEAVVSPIISRGHDVQLHMHTEWLAISGKNNPLGGKLGSNVKDFTLDEQIVLIDYARNTLIEAGAPAPIVFRAGSYGANDDTLRALSLLGIRYDSSYCPGILQSSCEIGLSSENRVPIDYCGVIEVPIGCIAEGGGGLRHAQITALSSGEMISALRHAGVNGVRYFTLVSHSFELMSRDRLRINKIVRRRFEKLCASLAQMSCIVTGTYASNPPCVNDGQVDIPVMPFSPYRKGLRLIEQGLSNVIYGAR